MRRLLPWFLVTVLLLAACTWNAESTADDAASPEVAFEPVAVPPGGAADGGVLSGLNLVAPSGDRPLLIAGVMSEPGVPSRAAFWTSRGGTPTSAEIDLGVDGAVQAVRVAASDELAVLAGYAWTGSSVEAFVSTSPDRRTWSHAMLPRESLPVRLTSAAVVDDTGFALGTDVDGRVHGVAVESTGLRTFSLPDLGDGERATGVAVAGHDDELVVLVRVASPGAVPVERVHRSPDAGATWVEEGLLDARDGVSAAGIAWTGSTYVVTGTALSDALDDRPAAWSSADGRTWSPDEIEVDPEFFVDSAAAGMSPPSASDGTASAVLWNDRSLWTGVLTTAGDGVWGYVGEERVELDIQVRAATATVADGRVYALMTGAGGASLHRIGADWDWSVLGTLGEPRRWESPARAADTGPDTLVMVRRPVFESEATEWRLYSSLALWRAESATLTEVPLEPAEAADLTDLVLSFADDGSAVVLGHAFDEGTIVVRGYHRPAGADSGADSWGPVSGFEGGGRVGVQDVTWTSSGWVAAGLLGTSSDTFDTVSTVFESADGVQWTSPSLEHPAGVGGSAPTAVCAMADGALVVGSGTDAAGLRVPLAWYGRDGTWTPVEGLGGRGWASGCAADGERAVVTGDQDGHAVVWNVTTGSGARADVVAELSVTDAIGDVTSVSGGYVAFGRVDRGEHTGPVLWLSAEGESWTWAPVPASFDSSSGVVLRDDEGALVLASGPAGSEAWRVALTPELLHGGAPGP